MSRRWGCYLCTVTCGKESPVYAKRDDAVEHIRDHGEPIDVDLYIRPIETTEQSDMGAWV